MRWDETRREGGWWSILKIVTQIRWNNYGSTISCLRITGVACKASIGQIILAIVRYTNLYSCHLWFNSAKSSLKKLSTSYNSVLRRLLGICKPYSASKMCVSRGIPTFAELLRTSILLLCSKLLCVRSYHESITTRKRYCKCLCSTLNCPRKCSMHNSSINVSWHTVN